MSERQNVVLICVDQWRGDCLSIDGHPVVHTPHLDELARTGARFRRAYSATPSCVPARVALMTGLDQRNHGRVGYQDGVPFDIETTLPGTFRRAGYQTQAIGKMHVTPERYRIGFDDVILHDGFMHHSRKRHRAYEEFDDYLPWLRSQPGQSPTADYLELGLNPNSMIARPWDKEERLHPTNWLTTQAVSWLYRRDPTVPFFLYLSYYYPHPPYNPPEWALQQYLDAPVDDPVVGDWSEDYAEFREDFALTARAARVGPQTLRRARAGYYGNIAHVDMQVNRFMDALAEFGLADDTYVAFTSDHGEMLGDHDLYRKAVPYEGSARVPFILKGPRESGIVQGGSHDVVVELRDVMPTLLDCAGVPSPPDIDGRSVLPIARGEHVPEWRSHLHGEHAWFGQSLQWLTDGTEKYCWLSRDGKEQLFDLSVDPGEEHDLAADPRYADRLAHWRDVLAKELTGREEGYVLDGKLVPGRPAQTLLEARRGRGGCTTERFGQEP